MARLPSRLPHYAKTGDISNWSESAEYVIHKEGSYYKATNGQTGKIDSKNTNPSTVIQYALDNTTTGKIMVNTDITQTVALTAVDDVQLDFTNHLVTLSGNENFLTMTQKTRFHLENVRLTVPSGYTGNIIELNSSTGTCRYNTFRNIWCDNPNAATQHGYKGIVLNITSTGNIFWNTFADMWFRGVDTGILFNLDHTSSWANGNMFNQIFIDRFVTMVNFDIFNAATNGTGKNTFLAVSGQTHSYSVDGFKNIRNSANHFENCTVWDWASAVAPNHQWSIHTDAEQTYIMCNDSPDNMDDNGTDTIIGHYGCNLQINNLNERGTKPLYLFMATTGNPFVYIYGDDHGTPNYGKMRISDWGHLQISHHQGGNTIELDNDGKIKVTPGGSEHLSLEGTKTTTGDPTAREGLIYINTFDNKIRMYADGSWRDLATW